MNSSTTESQRVLYAEIVRFCGQELNRSAEERTDSPVSEAWPRCAEIGLTGLPIPEEFGGSGLDPLSNAIALEAFGYGCRDGGLVFSVCAHLLACVVPIWQHGTEDQKRDLLPRLTSGGSIAANAITEADAGSDAFTMATTAEAEGDGFRIRGQKLMCTNAPIADYALVYARTDQDAKGLGGLSAFVVPMSEPGISSGQVFKKMGLDSAPLGEILLEDLWVPATALLGESGSGAVIFTQSMEWERILIAATHVGTMQRLLESAVAYARERKSGGRLIGDYQAISHKIANMEIQTEASRALVRSAADGLLGAGSSTMNASVVKTFVSESFVSVASDTLQVFGGHGYLSDTGIENVLRDAIGSTLYSGTNEIQRNIIASWLGL